MKPVVYCIHIGPNKQIGSTSRYSARMEEHRKALEANKHINKHLQAAYNKYNEFRYEVLQECETREQAYLAEQALLDQYYGTPGYTMLNKTATRPPVFYGENNAWSKKEVIDKCIETKRKNNTIYRSPETRKKLSEKLTGRKQSEAEVEKRAAILKAMWDANVFRDKHLEGVYKGLKNKSEKAKEESTKLFRENNPSYKKQICTYCSREIQGASAFVRFHGDNCKLNLNK